MTDYEALVKRVLIALGDKELKQAFNALYGYVEYNDKGELHKANDIFITIAREALIREPTLSVHIKNFIAGVYMVALNIEEPTALAYVQKNILNNTLN